MPSPWDLRAPTVSLFESSSTDLRCRSFVRHAPVILSYD
jgi:hypothetical protein